MMKVNNQNYQIAADRLRKSGSSSFSQLGTLTTIVIGGIAGYFSSGTLFTILGTTKQPTKLSYTVSFRRIHVGVL